MSLIYLTNKRLSFPNLVEAKAVKTDDPTKAVKKYGADFIMDINDPDYANFLKIYSDLAVAKWGNLATQVMDVIQADRKLRCFGNGNERLEKETLEPYNGYANNVYISANRKESIRPQMIQPDGNPIDANNMIAYRDIASSMYGGCYVNAAVNVWLQDNSHGRGVRCELVSIQFFKEGEPFGDVVMDASAMFGAVPMQPPANNGAPMQPPANNGAPMQPPANNGAPMQPPANNGAPMQPPANNGAPFPSLGTTIQPHVEQKFNQVVDENKPFR